jgi:hypothetical protein
MLPLLSNKIFKVYSLFMKICTHIETTAHEPNKYDSPPVFVQSVSGGGEGKMPFHDT